MTERLRARIKREIFNQTLGEVWSVLYNDKPFPNVKAFVVSQRDFRKVLFEYYHGKRKKQNEEWLMNEYGFIPKDLIEEIQSFTIFNRYSRRFEIYIRQHSRDKLIDLLGHELGHIYRGDVKISA